MQLKALTDAVAALTAAVTAATAKFSGEVVTGAELQPVIDSVNTAAAALTNLVTPPAPAA